MTRIIHISSKPPFPILDGGCFASARLLSDLHGIGYEVVHISLTTHKHPADHSAYPSWLTDIALFEIDTRIKLIPAIRCALLGRSYNMERFRNQAIDNHLNSIIKKEDVVLIDGLYASTFLSHHDFRAKHYILRSHNVEYRIWEELSKFDSTAIAVKRRNKKSLLRRMYLNMLAKQLKKYEQDIAKKVDQVWTITEEDEQEIKELGSEHVYTIPVSLPPNDFVPSYENNAMFHLGGAEWIPNAESIEWLRQLHGSLLSAGLPIELHLFGSGIENKNRPKEMVHGFVKDLQPALKKMGFLCAPILSGSGIRIKILETMAKGIPVITTSMGAKGIKDQQALMVVNSADDLLEAIRSMHASNELRELYGTKGRSYIESYHSESSVQKTIKDLLDGEA